MHDREAGPREGGAVPIAAAFLLSQRLRYFVAARIGAVLGRGSLNRCPELWPVTCKCPTSADPGILSGARRERELPVSALCVGGEFPNAGKIANELVSVRISPHAVAVKLLHGARDVSQAKAVPCHVVAKPQ
jgi:hypothetical protein